MDENGNGHFYGNAEKSTEITREIFNKLKIDNQTKYQVLTLIKYHDLDLQPTERYVKKLCYKLGNLDMVKKLILVQRADNFGQAPLHSERIEKFNQIDLIIEKLEQENLSFSLKDLAVNGNDLISLGFSGSDVGKYLKLLMEAVLNEQVKNSKPELIQHLNSYTKK
jgi:tRNA nucleotidyltransferase (CCA-adding enzyme)